MYSSSMKHLLRAVAMLAILSLAVFFVVDVRRPSQSIEILVLGTTNQDIGLPMMVFGISNRTTHTLRFGYETVIWTNNKWQRFDVINESPLLGKSVSPRSIETIEVFTPQHGRKWKVAFFYEWQHTTTFQRRLQMVLQRLGCRPRAPQRQFSPEMTPPG
jgi:hypothetical protein